MITRCPDCRAVLLGRRWLSAMVFVEVYQCLAVHLWGEGARPLLRCVHDHPEPPDREVSDGQQ
jgi:hypothetical protein